MAGTRRADRSRVQFAGLGALFGAACGFTSQIAHAGGPPFQMWVTPRHLPHETFVGTSSITFAVINWMKVPSYLALGSFNTAVLEAAALLIPLAIVATLAGVWLVRRMDSARFYTLVYLLMIGLGARLAWTALINLADQLASFPRQRG